ncbi:MAG: hypothetical protein OEX04_04150 [Acidimicrobiia bacterium]|nr:hypothetical protein [Acidimicrobiia bacterium]MDH4306650.1 hypothetical protein [Acidimicrobiia bacterium]MDH5295058.1 hypothetical protein [Acidimicrobiia bacterium]
MPAEPSERQVLYALVSAGFLAVVGVLIVGAGLAGLVPSWWTAASGSIWAAIAAVSALRWRQTGLLLVMSIGLFVAWTIGTLVVI